MSQFRSALGDIRSIRRQVARSTEFRGYGPATLAATGVVALLAGWVQALWVPAPAQNMAGYIGVWVATAMVAAAMTAAQMVTRARRLHSGLSNDMLRLAVEQFLPAVLAGVLLTCVLMRAAPGQLWLLPGLWQIVYSLGVFASCRFLPRPMLAVGGWFLLTGLVCVMLGDARALSPWTMGAAYGAGQMLAAGVLWAYAAEGPEADDEAQEA